MRVRFCDLLREHEREGGKGMKGANPEAGGRGNAQSQRESRMTQGEKSIERLLLMSVNTLPPFGASNVTIPLDEDALQRPVDETAAVAHCNTS